MRLALTRLPAIGVKKGSVIIIADGPGQPGINPQISGQGAALKLQKSYDIIGYDPRGVGQSTPKISCQLTESEEAPLPDENDIPGLEKQARDTMRPASNRRAAKWCSIWAPMLKSPLITREGDGHTLALSGADSCVDEAVVDYLLMPKKMRHDKSCR